LNSRPDDEAPRIVVGLDGSASIGSILSALSRWSVLAWQGTGGWAAVRSLDDQDGPVGEVYYLVRRAAENETDQVAAAT
jgi:hypothetical protein